MLYYVTSTYRRLSDKNRYFMGELIMRKTRKAITLLVNLVVIFFLAGCQQRERLLPPKADDKISFKTKSLIGYNQGSTMYSLGSIDSTYIFSENSLTVKSKEDEQNYAVTYNPQEVDKQVFGELLQTLISSSEIDISSYKNFLQYDLCVGIDNKPGYRLYVLDDEYWMGTLYGNRLWRCVTIEPIK